MCICGTSNYSNHFVCSRCLELKPGQLGWVCKNCGFLNIKSKNNCEICDHYAQCSEQDFWVCYCGEEKNNSENCAHCKRSRTDLFYCYICKCVLGSKKTCSKCKGEIRSEGYCIRCLGTQRGALCEECDISHWICKCEQVNEAADRRCSTCAQVFSWRSLRRPFS